MTSSHPVHSHGGPEAREGSAGPGNRTGHTRDGRRGKGVSKDLSLEATHRNWPGPFSCCNRKVTNEEACVKHLSYRSGAWEPTPPPASSPQQTWRLGSPPSGSLRIASSSALMWQTGERQLPWASVTLHLPSIGNQDCNIRGRYKLSVHSWQAERRRGRDFFCFLIYGFERQSNGEWGKIERDLLSAGWMGRTGGGAMEQDSQGLGAAVGREQFVPAPLGLSWTFRVLALGVPGNLRVPGKPGSSVTLHPPGAWAGSRPAY